MHTRQQRNLMSNSLASAAAQLQRDCVYGYEFNEASPLTAAFGGVDLEQAGNAAVYGKRLNGSSFVRGTAGGALRTASAATALNSGNTVYGVFRYNGNDISNYADAYVISLWEFSLGQRQWHVRFDSGSIEVRYTSVATAFQNDKVASVTYPIDDNWHVVEFFLEPNGSGTRLGIAIDGGAFTTSTHVGQYTSIPANRLTITGLIGGDVADDFQFEGYIDFVYLFDRPLNQAERNFFATNFYTLSEPVHEVWTPELSPNIIAYYDSLGTVAAVGATTDMPDLTANDRDLSGTNEPTKAAATINFDGTNDSLQSADFGLSAPLTVLMLCTAGTFDAGEADARNNFLDGLSTGRMLFRRRTATQSEVFYGSFITSNYPVANDETFLFGATYQVGTSVAYKNAAQLAQTTLAAAVAPGGFYVGSRLNTNRFNQFNLHALAVISGISSESERNLFEGFMTHRHGQTALLPSDHAFKNNAP